MSVFDTAGAEAQKLLSSAFDSTDDVKLDDIALANAVIAQSSGSSLAQRAAVYSVVKKFADLAPELIGLPQVDAAARLTEMLTQQGKATGAKIDAETTLFSKQVDTTAQDLLTYLNTQYSAQGQAVQANIGLDTEARSGITWIEKAKGFIGGLLTAGAEMLGIEAPAFAKKWASEAENYSSKTIQGGSRIAQSSGDYSALNAINSNQFDGLVGTVTTLIKSQQGQVGSVVEKAAETQVKVAPDVISGSVIKSPSGTADLGLNFSENAPRPNVGDSFGDRLRNSLLGNPSPTPAVHRSLQLGLE